MILKIQIETVWQIEAPIDIWTQKVKIVIWAEKVILFDKIDSSQIALKVLYKTWDFKCRRAANDSFLCCLCFRLRVEPSIWFPICFRVKSTFSLTKIAQSASFWTILLFVTILEKSFKL